MFNKKMIWQEIEKQGLDKDIRLDELMKYHTSWKIGGIADFFCIPGSLEKLKKIITFASKYDLPIYIIGNGSNILVSDNGIRGIVIKLAGAIDKIEYSGKMIKAGSGILLPDLVRKTVIEELSGLEFAAHIPGTLGGAIINNASFGNNSISQIVNKIEVLDYNGNVTCIDKDKYTFFYRGVDLGFKNFIIINIFLEMAKEEKDKIISRIKDFYNQRKKNQPIELLTAGCIFKNTDLKPAGYLIEKSGAKGLSVGDAQVSEKHANFIINRGEASSRDILLLIEKVEKMVEKEFGILLEKEINLVGFNSNQ